MRTIPAFTNVIHRWGQMVFAGLFMCTWSLPSFGLASSIGYRVNIFEWDPPGHKTDAPSLAFIDISPTQDGLIRVADGMKPKENVGQPDLKKWTETLLLSLEDQILEGYIDRRLVVRGSQFHEDLRTKETVLDGRSWVIALVHDYKVWASIRVAFPDSRTGNHYLPAELRAPGGPREIFKSEPLVNHDVPPASESAAPLTKKLHQLGLRRYQTGGKCAELKGLLSREDISNLDLLPLIFRRLLSDIGDRALELGLPIPESLCGETTKTHFEKIYKNWGFELVDEENDPTLTNTLVHIRVSITTFTEKMRDIMNRRGSESFVQNLLNASSIDEGLEALRQLRNPSRMLYHGFPGAYGGQMHLFGENVSCEATLAKGPRPLSDFFCVGSCQFKDLRDQLPNTRPPL